MWIQKKITLLHDAVPAAGSVISVDELDAHQQGLAIVEQARQQAEALLQQASAEIAARQAEAEAAMSADLQQRQQQLEQDFYQQADALFHDWQQQQAAWQETVLPRTQALLAQALEQILGEQPAPARLHALLMQLLTAQGRAASATLFCAPAQQQDVDSWLAERPHLIWTVKNDGRLANDQLVLETDQGELRLSWEALCGHALA